VTSGDFTDLDFDNIGYQLFELSPASATIGQNSQLASVGGNGIILGNNATGFSLSDLTGGQTKVYDGGRRTARLPGREQIMTSRSEQEFYPPMLPIRFLRLSL